MTRTFGPGERPTTYHPIYGPQDIPNLFHIGDTVTCRQSDRAPFEAKVEQIQVLDNGSVKYFCRWSDRITGSDWFWPEQVA